MVTPPLPWAACKHYYSCHKLKSLHYFLFMQDSLCREGGQIIYEAAFCGRCSKMDVLLSLIYYFRVVYVIHDL